MNILGLKNDMDDRKLTWIRKGKLFGNDTWNLGWHRLNTQLPIPYLIDSKRLRLFVTFCDADNRGRLGFVDVNPSNPAEIIDYSKKPLLELGAVGRFDENGVVSTAILEEDNKIYLYYCGFQKHVNYPYSSLAGVAVSYDRGQTFVRIRETPLLERIDGEMFIRTGVGIYKFGDIYRLYYASGNEWINLNGKIVPRYSFKYIESDTPIRFEGKGNDLFPLENDEYGMTTPQIFRTDNGYDMIYSIRTVSEGYRMGYASSEDGVHFTRNDGVMDIKRPNDQFDSEMICYGKCFKYNERTYLFYCGNHYGMDGIGWAELNKWGGGKI